MGDHRYSFKAEFEMHGVKDTLNLGWMNWAGGRNDIDSRIIEWIESVRDRAFLKFDDEMDAAEEIRNRESTERREREELARLKEKYEAKP